ncbi:DNA topoisomerase IB [Streptomyces sp. NPDC051921]|uniref:DNA topoisomerase IB n=1 Tax=Streptomyces sp. NPDC051921 TaxID=3155806 RepID=UPI0034169C9B
MTRQARLRTSDPGGAGYRRVRCGRGFRYLDPAGRTVPPGEARDRIRALAVPPAWRDVWICPWPDGHLQATGTDAAGRRQYLYHQRFRALREAAKHDHAREVSTALPRLRAAVERDLASRGLTRTRVLACATRLLDLGFFRVGSQAYVRDNSTYGLTTLRREHVDCGRGEICFHYPAKNGTERTCRVTDPAARTAVRSLLRRRDTGPALFAYWEGRAWHELRATDLNDYLRDRSGAEMTAKDFRTWNATVLAAVALAVSRRAEAPRRAVTRAVREVSAYLGNTPAVCRASYIDPRVVESYERGRTIAPALEGLGARPGRPAIQGPVEEAVRRLLA